MHDLEHIRQLIFLEITGDLSPSDQQVLSKILADNEGIRAMRAYMQEVFKEQTQTAIPFYAAQQRIAKRIRQQRNKRMAYSIGTVTIAIITCITLGILYIPGKEKRADNQKIVANYKNQGLIRLQLANGEEVNLDTTTTLTKGGIHLSTRHKTLSYSVSNTRHPEWATITVPPGKDYNIQLADGTNIQLNASSTLRFPIAFTGATREVTITGEAYISVAHRANQPFLVHLPHTTVKVLGTEFNVNTYDDKANRIALVHGAVKVYNEHDSILLRPGFQVTNVIQEGMQTDAFDVKRLLSWREGKYYFHHLTLPELSSTVFRYLGIQLQIENKELANTLFSGTINKNQPLDMLLQAMRLDFYKDPSGIYHIK
jgi:ferric-dicitrate binding protein FerR (iron transport regulator)